MSARRANTQRFGINRVQSAANGAFEPRHIGKVEQRRGRLEALQKFRKAFAVKIEPGGARRFARDETCPPPPRKNPRRRDDATAGKFRRSALVRVLRDVLR